jgi:hypothetical protein
MARDKDHSQQALKEVTDALYRATVGGVRAIYTDYPNTAHLHRTNTRRSLARDHIVHLLRAELTDHPRVTISDRNQTTYFCFRCPNCELCNYQILVKKCDEFGAVALERTQASLDFQRNVEPDLFEYEVTNLYLGYVPNPADPTEPAVYLICPTEGGYDWAWELEPAAGAIAGEVGGAGVPPADDGDDLVRIPQEKKSDESE